MKILLSTIVDNINFGTYLQAFATAHLLKHRNAEVEILNYIRPYLDGKFYARNIYNDKSKPLISRAIRSCGYYILNGFMIWNLKRFLTGRAKLTKKITSHEDLIKKFNKKYDLYLTGSDQVWNTQHNLGVDSVFFFDGIDGEKRSYAASVGMESFQAGEEKRIAEMLSDYSLISVRESFGVDALKKIGIENSVQVLDPTLLLNAEEWIKICGQKFHKTEKYLLIYSVELEKNEEVYQIALKIAAERGLKVYLVCPTLKFKKSFPKIDRLFSLATVELFISLFSQADFVVCSSFHGTAFSINFNRQFITIAPQRFNTRVNSLLKLLNLEERYVENVKYLPMETIDYNKVNKTLQQERGNSLKVLDSIINYGIK